MTFAVQIEAPPFREDSTGALRVGKSRVLLELVIRAFQDGQTPEMIAQQFPSLTLPDIYATVAYYLRHGDQIELYLTQREQKGQQAQKRIEDRQGNLSKIRQRLMARSRTRQF